MSPELAALHPLELSLWQTATRFDRAIMDATLARDFLEFGRSGRRYSRDELLSVEGDRQNIDASLHHLATRRLSGDLVLVTYISEVRHPEGTQWANRSSIWDRSTGHWQLRFHQGTPCEALT